MLNVHQLNVFVTAAETLNFTQTARKLHLAQSSVSQHIKSLENQLGIELFERKGRTLEITEAGKVLLPMARDIVNGSIKASEQMELLKKEIHGHLIVGCNTAPGKYMLPLMLADFHRQYPLVRITCQVLPQKQTLEGLEEGSVHFAITNLMGEDTGSAEFQMYMQEPILLIVPEGHPWVERSEVEPEDLLDEQFIMREASSGTYKNVKQALFGVGVDIEKLNVVLEMGTSEALALAVQQDLGIGFVSEMILDKICRSGVEVVKLKGMEIQQDLYFGRQTSQPASGAQSVFWDFINEQGVEIFKHDYVLNDSLVE